MDRFVLREVIAAHTINKFRLNCSPKPPSVRVRVPSAFLLADVQRLAEEMLPIFQTQNVDRETLAALRFFQESARRQELTVEKVHELAAWLRRAVTDQLPRPADFPPSRPAG